MKLRNRRAGFSLIEIMVALIVGIITITVAYTLTNGTSKVLSEQHRVSQTQTAVRLAMEQIRADIERAGLFGTPNAQAETTCISPPATFQAITYTADQYTLNIPNAAKHRVKADGLVLTGNYLTSGSYLAGIGDNVGGVLELQTTWQSFRRDFGDPISTDAFQRVFENGRWLHITTQQGMHFFTQVNATPTPVAGNVQMAINPTLTPGGMCVVGLGDGSTMSPMNSIEYALLNPADAANTELAALVGLRTGEDQATRELIEGIPSVLVRREVNPVTRLVVAGTTRVVLEYAVEFDLEFDIDTTSGPGIAPTISRVVGAAAQTVVGDAGTGPQRVRAVHVRLSARTPEAEPTIPWAERAVGAPLTRYWGRPNPPATNLHSSPSSRVRTLTTTVFVPNVAAADLP